MIQNAVKHDKERSPIYKGQTVYKGQCPVSQTLVILKFPYF